MQVGVTDTSGTVLGIFRTNDATMFSLDIVIQKARTVVIYSDPTQTPGKDLRTDLGVAVDSPLAISTRTTGFLAQPFYPPGIDGTAAGPLYMVQQNNYEMNGICDLTPDGVTLFPGSTPLYKSGILVGGLGISGDGVDQDDYVTNAAAKGFLPASAIRADQITFRGTRLPFFKFPRQPNL
jgi:uncharacterized protein GlcG (DUF336 family)